MEGAGIASGTALAQLHGRLYAFDGLAAATARGGACGRGAAVRNTAGEAGTSGLGSLGTLTEEGEAQAQAEAIRRQ